jgi:hypothetical protein
MLLTPHIAVGIYLTRITPPVISIPAALISHILFDFFCPHWNPHLYTEIKKYKKLTPATLKVIAIDILLSGFFILFSTLKFAQNTSQVLTLWAASFFAILPDIITIPFFFLKSKNKFLKSFIDWSSKHQANAEKTWGLISQAIVLLIVLWQLL